MQDGFDLSIIVFLLLAVFVGWRLYSVLGTRSGRDDQAPTSNLASVVKLVSPVAPRDATAEPVVEDQEADPARWKGIAELGTPLADSLDALVAADRSFDAKQFITGARGAYEAIVVAFASGDRNTLRELLSRDVFESFVAAIADREKRGETVETTFVGIEKAELHHVQLRGNAAQITVQFLSKLITATRDAAGVITDGAADKVVDVTDIWTFARELTSRDPVWKLIATEAAH
ncbi:MAG: Tim44 domain-containing protein [Alphaproteobacteria bacterium]|jgi:predicted lipid-binding transport protein (Tim44 family)|nr:Tim44/TimA family putative adaptor protein [Beijerinckiaceae bacterium]NBQ38828.1 Tim44 domain-containing protein [Alphaproteobacteria bacterium]